MTGLESCVNNSNQKSGVPNNNANNMITGWRVVSLALIPHLPISMQLFLVYRVKE